MLFSSAALKSVSKLATLSSKASFSSKAVKNVVIVAGTRLPFATTTSIYMDELAVDLQRLAITGLLTKTALPKEEVDYVYVRVLLVCSCRKKLF